MAGKPAVRQTKKFAGSVRLSDFVWRDEEAYDVANGWQLAAIEPHSER